MTGLGIDEPVFQPAKIEQLLGLGRPGEVVRNLLSEAHGNHFAWNALQASIKKLFDYELLPPDASGRTYSRGVQDGCEQTTAGRCQRR